MRLTLIALRLWWIVRTTRLHTDVYAPGAAVTFTHNYAALNNNVADGTTAFPVTTAGPTVRFSRTEQYAAPIDDGNNECNAVILVNTYGLHPTTQQTMGILSIAQSEGQTAAEFAAYNTAHPLPATQANNDVVGIAGIGNVRKGNRGGGAGAFLMGMRNDDSGTCSIMEGTVRNGSDLTVITPPADATINASGPANVAGFVATCGGRGGKGGDAFVVHSADGGTTRWKVAFHTTTLGPTDNTLRVDDSSTTVALVNGTHAGLIDASAATFNGTAAILKLPGIDFIDGAGHLGIGAVPANMFTTRILNYVANTDIIAAAIAASTLTDVCANQSFTVADASSVVTISVRGNVQINAASIGTAVVTVLIDSAGTPQTFKLAGTTIAASGWGNALSGADTIAITGLAAGAHTVKVQIQAQMATTVNCRASTQATWEHLAIQVVETRR